MFISKPYHDPKVWGYEDWLISTLDKASLVQGNPLSQLVGSIGDLNYLVKVLNTEQSLSVQVHPSNDLVESGKFGKDECWLITDTKPGAGIYAGVRENIGLEQLREAIENKDDVSKLMNFLPVNIGDFVQLPAGTIHALGEGIELVEVQSAVDITYRLWDWNREPERELHIEKGLMCCDLSLWRENDMSLRTRDCFNEDALLLHHSLFSVEVKKVSQSQILSLTNTNRAKSIIVLSGEMIVNQQTYGKFSSFIIDKSQQDVEIKGNDLVLMVVQ